MDGAFPNVVFPARVGSFALDRFEVTVGRFRRFVDAWDSGWRPRAGAGTQSQLNGGSGLVDSSGDGGQFETGWDVSWAGGIATDLAGWDTNLGTCGGPATWTLPDGTKPINCVSWFEAYAFCIWDGGFLPSEAEWSYAAVGGGDASGQRNYPWSVPSDSTELSCDDANYSDCPQPNGIDPVGSRSPNGDGRWGQADLLGNVWEWTLDFMAPYRTPCTDCAYLGGEDAGRSIRGGDFVSLPSQILVSNRVGTAPGIRYKDDGVRCARVP